MLVSTANKGAAKLTTIAQWRDIRRVYPIYTAIAREFGYADPPYASLDDVGSESEAEVIGKVEAWLAEMDERFEPHQFRAILERPELGNSEEKLRGLVQRCLHKQDRSSADRDKLHYLLAQYAFVCAPPSFRSRLTRLSELAEVLEPVLGSASEKPAGKLQALTGLVPLMPRCSTFPALEASVVVPGRQLKAGLEETGETATGLLVITHFNYSLRCAYSRLLAEELRASAAGLEKLQAARVATVDGTALGLSTSEPLEILRQSLNEFSSVAPADDAVITARSEQVRALRSIIDAALKNIPSAPPPPDERLPAIEAYVQQLVTELGQAKAELQNLRRVVEGMSEPHQDARSGLAMPAPAAAVATPAEPSPAPAEVKPQPTARPERDYSPEVNRCVTALRRVLQPNRAQPSCTVKVKAATLVLSRRDMELLYDDSAAAVPMHRAITARILLHNLLEQAKQGTAVEAGSVINFARATLLELQRLLDTDGAPDGLAAAAEPLRSVLQQAEAAFQVAK